MNTATALLICSTFLTVDLPQRDNLVDFLIDPARQKQLEQQTKDELESANQRLKDCRRGKITGTNTKSRAGLTFQDKEAKQKATEAAAATVAQLTDRLKEKPIIDLPLLGENLRVGNVGRVFFIHLRQIVDAENALCDLGETLVWVSLPTAGLVDDSNLNVERYWWEATGTTTYQTVGGASKTIYTLRPFDPDPYIEQAKKAK